MKDFGVRKAQRCSNLNQHYSVNTQSKCKQSQTRPEQNLQVVGQCMKDGVKLNVCDRTKRFRCDLKHCIRQKRANRVSFHFSFQETCFVQKKDPGLGNIH